MIRIENEEEVGAPKKIKIETGLSRGEKTTNVLAKILRIFWAISILITLGTYLFSKDSENRTIGYIILAGGLSVFIFPWIKQKFFPKKTTK